MLTHITDTLTAIFFYQQQGFSPKQFYHLQHSQDFLQQPQFLALKQYGIELLITPSQTHGTEIVIITSKEQAEAYRPYSQQADAVITNVPSIALGVATADCLPIIMYDPDHHVAAIVHAGWRGTVAGIAAKTVQAMIEHFNSQPDSLQILFGPSASVEQYEVSADFCDNIEHTEYLHETLLERNSHFYFNVPLYNQRLLEELSVTKFDYTYNLCPITNSNFCSHRRDKEHALRQMSVVALK